MYDVIIVGAGVSGAAIARELSRYQVKACVLEREEDVCCGTSKANSAIVHAGYDAPTGSLMAKLNVRGSEMMENLSKELDFHFERNGSLILCTNEKDIPNLKALLERGRKNGVKGLELLSKEEVLEMEPNVTDHVAGALYAPTGGIVCPFNLNISLAENANENGIEFRFNTEVLNIKKTDKGFAIETNKGIYETHYLVNAAGVYADKLHNMVSEKKINIIPRRGDYWLLDKKAGNHVKKTIFTLPGKYGKGVLVAPTVHGNLIIGPTAIDITDKEGVNTTKEGLEEVIKKANMSVKNIPVKQVITSFSGLRAHEENHEFIIEEIEDAKGFIDCAGIESPGLSSCPAIGEMVANMLKEKMKLKKNPYFVGTRKGLLDPSALSVEERNKLIKKNPAYGNIICRCESISEGEIMDAINRPIGAKSLDAIKRRTRAGSGRCQGGFCMPKTMEIIARERKEDIFHVTKFGGNSKVIVGTNKDSI